MAIFNETQLKIINETIATGIDAIHAAFPQHTERNKFLQLLINLNTHSLQAGLMSENPNQKFKNAKQALLQFIFKPPYRGKLADVKPLFYLCGRHSIDTTIVMPLKRLQTDPVFSEAQHAELKKMLHAKLSSSLQQAPALKKNKSNFQPYPKGK